MQHDLGYGQPVCRRVPLQPYSPAHHPSQQPHHATLAFGNRQHDERRKERPEAHDRVGQELQRLQDPRPPRESAGQYEEGDERTPSYKRHKVSSLLPLPLAS